ncbi:2-isopropylmalate synthase [Nonomuraea candida]|uniref:2-isopropylmalate synthase n=1 Tax=Nonomuraea candida TaxID=359159 RepID=UPI0005BB3356|nr:2-isopropylmalate synthase [Nonomuraea candida]
MKTNRYAAFPTIPLDDRSWPAATLTAAPRWLSTDLRDGNQALARPMSPERKLALFELLVSLGYKEIEVGFPSASQDDYDFVRLLVEEGRIPADVRITAFAPAREELIERTMESLRGASSATFHLYNATSPLVRRLVLGMDREQCRELAVQGTRLVMAYADKLVPDCDLAFQYSPEHFNDTELDFSLEVCEAVMDVWEPGPDRPIILNFPTTVERSMPNVFADQIEWMHRNLSRREHVCLSVHPHNDRGTGVASAELALLAGAQRVEGCLFGNGERAGNVCLVTLGMNLFTQGIEPGIDFSDLDRVRRIVESCTGMPVPARHPYGGDLVYTAFSGTHQDAIKKGVDAMEREAGRTGLPASELPWSMPYLLVDPRDVGRTYEAIVRINSQSGKGGLAYVMSARHGLTLPRPLQIDFARVVQALADAEGGEIGPDRVREVFEATYAVAQGAPAVESATVELHIDGPAYDGSRAWSDTLRTLRSVLAVRGFDVRAVHHGGGAAGGTGGGTGGGAAGDREAVAVYAECAIGDRTAWGAGIAGDVESAALAAVGSAVLRARPAHTAPQPRVRPQADAECRRPRQAAARVRHVIAGR